MFHSETFLFNVRVPLDLNFRVALSLLLLQKLQNIFCFQHFPLFRESDASCTEPDAPPLPERNIRFRIKIDALAKNATDYLATKIKPRAVFGGHTHHGCLLQHSYGDIQFEEHSVPSFSWRNRPDPKYMLVSTYYLRNTTDSFERERVKRIFRSHPHFCTKLFIKTENITFRLP